MPVVLREPEVQTSSLKLQTSYNISSGRDSSSGDDRPCRRSRERRHGCRNILPLSVLQLEDEVETGKAVNVGVAHSQRSETISISRSPVLSCRRSGSSHLLISEAKIVHFSNFERLFKFMFKFKSLLRQYGIGGILSAIRSRTRPIRDVSSGNPLYKLG